MASDVYTSAGEEYIIDAIGTAIGTGAAVETGIGTTAAAKGDTALANTTGCPAKAASTTKTQPAADTLQFVKTVAYTSSLAITEVGLFADATSGALIQRH